MSSKKSLHQKKAWVVAVDMGYGHQRAAYPLRRFAYRGAVINANTYPGIPHTDRVTWKQSREVYEAISRFKKTPFIGNAAFELFDAFQAIPAFYPKRDLSKPTLQLKQVYRLIHKGWGKSLVQKLSKNSLPLITTFFIPAYMAEEHQYPGPIYLVLCDADVSRAWAALNPKKSTVTYLAPSRRAAERLKLYGVPKERIIHTGFPLPTENIGTETRETVKQDLARRIRTLDARGVYTKHYRSSIRDQVGLMQSPRSRVKPLTVMFAVGGVGAQREIGGEILTSLCGVLKKKKVRLILVAGIHNDVNRYFRRGIAANGLTKLIGKSVFMIYANTKNAYFAKFNKALRETDILWTKPSELSFYCALGIPLIIAPPIGSQEKYNRKWLRAIGAGIDQENPTYVHEWLFDWINAGWLADAAMQGYFGSEQLGTYRIAQLLAQYAG